METNEPKKLLSYSDVIALTKDTPKLILLGNEFSMSYNKDRFSFTDLLNSAIESGIIDKDGPINKTFKQFKTTDFEAVIKALEDANKVLTSYGLPINKKFKEDASKLKEHLIKVITNNHPEKSTDLKLEEIAACMNFIKGYKSVYTLNYDILLYWVIMRADEVLKDIKYPLFEDGFGNANKNSQSVIFRNEGGNSFSLHYLHGGLHLFNKGADVAKLTFSKTETPLTSQIKTNLENDQYPVFISEGSAEAKKEKITHNPYLNHCYKSLSSIGKTLVIFGTELKRNDEHIKSAIIESNCPQIFIGVGSADKIQNWSDFESKFLSKMPLMSPAPKQRRVPMKRNIYYYDYHTVDVWGHNAK